MPDEQIQVATHKEDGTLRTTGEMCADVDAQVERQRPHMPCKFPAPPVSTVGWGDDEWDRYIHGSCLIHAHAKEPTRDHP